MQIKVSVCKKGDKKKAVLKVKIKRESYLYIYNWYSKAKNYNNPQLNHTKWTSLREI